MKTSMTIPQKSHFKLDEVCGITGVKPYVLRFWESEFEEISPISSSTGTKLFGHKDIEVIYIIKKLLFEDKLTVEQAKREFFINPHLAESGLGVQEQESLTVVENGAITKASQTGNFISDEDLHKLIAAQNKLKNILALTDGF